MPTLPRQLILGHRKIKIHRWTSKTASRRNAYGEFMADQDKICIDRNLKPKVMANTLLHEIMHLIAQHYHWELPARDEERVCETTGNAMSDLFTQNPKLVEFLHKSFIKQ
jgi:hypothetical protein